MKTVSQKARRVSPRGILAGGNWIIDQVKLIDVFPQPEQLANIQGQAEGTGGAPYNVLVDLARLGADFPLHAAGLVGKDALGDRILADCRAFGIRTGHLGRTTSAPTSYTDVMTETRGGRRTFFHNRGANALWTGSDLDFERLKVRVFHLGYLLLLDALDGPDRRWGTRAAALLAKAQAAGIRTSVDVVSESSDRFGRIVVPALKYVDYCILNELEAGNTTGHRIRRPDGGLDTAALRRAAAAMFEHGVRELVVIHFPEGGFARTQDGQEYWQASLNIPTDRVAGTAGAGDAFCAGVLLGLHEGWDLPRCLRTAVLVAAASLSHPTCTRGVKALSATLRLAKKYGFKPVLPNGTAA